MVFGKLLAFLHRKKKPYLIADMLPKSTFPDFIIVPPEQNVSHDQDGEVKEKEEELCEEPRALETFHAANPQIAREKAVAKNLLIFYAGRERWDLFGRSHVYHCITPEFALKLLRLESDMKNEREFSSEEREILRNLTLKGWVKRLQNGGVYYYGLNRRTVIILQRQLFKRSNSG